MKACEDDPNVERKKAARARARVMKLHPHNIAQKTEVIVEHFQAVARHRIGILCLFKYFISRGDAGASGLSDLKRHGSDTGDHCVQGVAKHSGFSAQ